MSNLWPVSWTQIESQSDSSIRQWSGEAIVTHDIKYLPHLRVVPQHDTSEQARRWREALFYVCSLYNFQVFHLNPCVCRQSDSVSVVLLVLPILLHFMSPRGPPFSSTMLLSTQFMSQFMSPVSVYELYLVSTYCSIVCSLTFHTHPFSPHSLAPDILFYAHRNGRLSLGSLIYNYHPPPTVKSSISFDEIESVTLMLTIPCDSSGF